MLDKYFLMVEINKYIYLLAPVHTILPELNIRAVVRGSRILIITAAKRFGLNSAFLALRAISLRSSLQSKLTVHTMFLANTRNLWVIQETIISRQYF